MPITKQQIDADKDSLQVEKNKRGASAEDYFRQIWKETLFSPTEFEEIDFDDGPDPIVDHIQKDIRNLTNASDLRKQIYSKFLGKALEPSSPNERSFFEEYLHGIVTWLPDEFQAESVAKWMSRVLSGEIFQIHLVGTSIAESYSTVKQNNIWDLKYDKWCSLVETL